MGRRFSIWNRGVLSKAPELMGADTTQSWDWESRYAKAPSSEEILAEIDPFLEVIGYRKWSMRVRYLALGQMCRSPKVDWTFIERTWDCEYVLTPIKSLGRKIMF